MKNAKNVKLFNSIVALTLFIMSSFLAICSFYFSSAKETVVIAETIYSDSFYMGDEYGGQTSQVSAEYSVYYDSYQVVADVSHVNAPSYGSSDPNKSNFCAPLAGMNIVAFYDRWSTNLIPNFEPGMVFSNGTYHYYPDMGRTETNNAYTNIYNLMKTGELGGTTSANFKSGLNTYVNNAGYSFSYNSMYKNTTSVDLDKLTTAVNQGKVGVVMCSEYNFVSSMTEVASESRFHVVKRNSTVAHMMMVYGYKTVSYYKNGSNFRNDTFLYVCSSYGSGEKGYMLLDNFLKIDEALIMTIS